MAKNQAKAPGAKQGDRLRMNKARPSSVFERRFGREKHRVVNRKSKTDDKATGKGSGAVGKPGMARLKALEKRKATLLPEYERRGKSNVFVDRRIGETDTSLSLQEKMIARFAAERLRKKGKKSLFNIANDDDNDDDGLLGVEAGDTTLTHFGKDLSQVDTFEDPRSDDEDDDVGKRLSAKTVKESHFGGFMTKSDLEFAEGRANSRKDWIETMIVESKKRKAEKQKTQEEAMTMTLDLDAKWKGMMGSLRSSGQIYTKKESVEDAAKEESYDVILRELGLERGGKVATDRLKTEEEVIKDEKDKLERLEADRIKRMGGQENNDDVDMDESSESESSEDEDEDEDGSEGSEEDDFSDVAHDSDEEDTAAVKKAKTAKSEVPRKNEKDEVTSSGSAIPFTFKVPDTFEELVKLFTNRSPEEKSLIVQRVIKCNHPQFGNNNKAKLEGLFTFLLQYIHDCAFDFGSEESGQDSSLKDIQELTPYLFDLAKFSPQPSANAILSVIDEKYEGYSKEPRKHIPFEAVVFLKLACLLFPTSDYRHPVTTPVMQFIAQTLAACKVNSRESLATGLLLSSIMTESCQLSKRFSPELLNFLVGIVYVSFPKERTKVVPYVSPFKVVGEESTLLYKYLSSAPKSVKSIGKLRLSDVRSSSPIDAAFSFSCLHTALRLLKELVPLWSGLPTATDIFHPLSCFLPRLESVSLPEAIVKEVAEVKAKLDALQTQRVPISVEAKKPKILRLLEPEVEDNFNPLEKKRSKANNPHNEAQKMLHKMKRERKGARKDIRADSAFLAVQKHKEMRERDFQRQKKTKDILASLGNQEGDYRKTQKKKRK